ncbi:hypothetical protein [Cohnella fermenti]|uniref:Tfp pilus assembly protein PilO n=1 Tax=Cohnella fermenti TaxID=2565925 RepID=A0A4S4C394_9BACL|nr:hypothetical protein [Cohnella fermenti]THF82196.1 hypothetical protein E6C55_07385 [Cohnella fermenti]
MSRLSIARERSGQRAQVKSTVLLAAAAGLLLIAAAYWCLLHGSVSKTVGLGLERDRLQRREATLLAAEKETAVIDPAQLKSLLEQVPLAAGMPDYLQLLTDSEANNRLELLSVQLGEDAREPVSAQANGDGAATAGQAAYLDVIALSISLRGQPADAYAFFDELLHYNRLSVVDSFNAAVDENGEMTMNLNVRTYSSSAYAEAFDSLGGRP